MRHILVLLASIVFGGCASIVNGTTKEVSIETEPPDALVEVEGQRKTTPCSFELRRDEDHGLRISKPGYKTYYVHLRSVEGGAIFGNLLFGGLIGVAVDAGSGASKTLEPDDITIVMERGVGEVSWKESSEGSVTEEESPAMRVQ
ncbi:MAG: PEGA domain-containing protein [Planctomycetes bacterium]|nr:PEGA domain-containing protein [Planctomycetota bacterium]